jgi:hypothetical protein
MWNASTVVLPSSCSGSAVPDHAEHDDALVKRGKRFGDRVASLAWIARHEFGLYDLHSG